MKTLFRLNFVLAILFFLPSISSAQIKEGVFEYGTSADWYMGYSIIHTSDGGYAICGTSLNNSLLMYVPYMIKLDASFNVQWSKYIKGSYGSLGYALIQTFDGGYALAGATSFSSGGNDNAWIIKLSSTGTLQWNTNVTALTTNNQDKGLAIIQTKDSGYAVGVEDQTSTKYNAYLMKLNSAGKLKWTRQMSGTYNTYINSLVENKKGEIITCGTTQNYGKGGENVYLATFDTAGNLINTRTIGGTKREDGNCISHTRDGGYIIAGTSISFGLDSINGDVYAVKLDSAMNIQWTRTVGGSREDDGYSVSQTIDGGYAIAGVTYSFSDTNQGDLYIVKLDSAGNLKWTVATGTVGNTDNGNSVVQTPDGGCAVIGITTTCSFCSLYAFLIKTDSAGKICTHDSTGGIVRSGGAIDSGGTATIVSLLTGFGASAGNGPGKVTVCSIASTDDLPNASNVVTVYPNPNKGVFTIQVLDAVKNCTVEVYNVFGQNIFTGKQMQIQHEAKIDIGNQPDGIYFYKISNVEGRTFGEGKMVIGK